MEVHKTFSRQLDMTILNSYRNEHRGHTSCWSFNINKQQALKTKFGKMAAYNS
jgi:hypothetical protein